jgi:hypothetical protein
MEDKVRAAIIDELMRQAEDAAELQVSVDGDRLIVQGPVDVDALVIVVLVFCT